MPFDQNYYDQLLNTAGRGAAEQYKQSTTTSPAVVAPVIPSGMIALGDTARGQGLTVGNNGAVPMINGTAINTNGLQNIGGHWYGTSEQINGLLQPFQTPTFTPPPQQTYQSPYSEQEKKALDEYNAWAAQPWASPYATDIENLVKQSLSRSFNYNPQNDQAFQLAAKELTRNVMESMNARGILNSTVTENQVQQGVSDLMPQYQQIARQNFMDEGNMLMSQINMLAGLEQNSYQQYQDKGKNLAQALDVVMRMDDTQYQRWHDAYTDTYTRSLDTYKAATDKWNADRQKVQDAWDRVSNMGYVDNKASIILGVPPGTLSKEAREAKVKREQELADQKTELENSKALNQQQYELNVKLDDHRTANDLKIQKESTGSASTADINKLGTTAQVGAYNDIWASMMQNINNGTMSAADLYTYALQHPDLYNGTSKIGRDMGSKLYQRMLADLKALAAANKSYGNTDKVDTNTTATVDDYAARINSLYVTKIGTRTIVDKAGVKEYLDGLLRSDPSDEMNEIVDSLAAEYGIQ